MINSTDTVNYDITIHQGKTFKFGVTVNVPTNPIDPCDSYVDYCSIPKTPVNLTGSTIYFVIREITLNKDLNDTPVISLMSGTPGTDVINIPTPTNGYFEVVISDVTTAKYRFKKALYEINIRHTDGTLEPYISGKVILKEGVQ